MIHRYSSRRASLAPFLPERLRGTVAYDRIAGFFSSSVLEIAGESLEEMAEGVVARVVCNSHLDPLDVATARAAKQVMWQEWSQALPRDISPVLKARLRRLYQFLSSGRLRVRVLADGDFGLIHGKAGVITAADGSQSCFLGSVNESVSAWRLNYELVWTEDSPEGVRWVQEEFDALWSHPGAVELADAVIQDADRLSRREVIPEVAEWKNTADPDPAAPVIELPVYRQENGLWAHQKYFVKLAFDQHRHGGARLLLADQVGLGKTVQLALAAELMALWGDRPVLVLVPKSLMSQWQDELWDLLRLPSAVWTGRCWQDEQGVVYADCGTEGLRDCPRRVGIVSTGLVIHSQTAAGILKGLRYECVILDEAHRARRRNLGPMHQGEPAEPNNLLTFLQEVSPNARSLLLATATPVQIDPIEAWDLLEALNRDQYGNRDRGAALGTRYSQWIIHPWDGLAYVLHREPPPEDLAQIWEWMRDPFPPASEHRSFGILRRSLNLNGDATWAPTNALDKLSPADRSRLADLSREFFQKHNPFLRTIVRRTREYLEETIDPRTNEPYLRPVRVRLFGEGEDGVVPLPTFLRDAYEAAEKFCEIVGQRPGLNSGFLKTILLRRVGSTLEAGHRTALKMLGSPEDLEEEDDDEGDAGVQAKSSLYPLAPAEEEALLRFVRLLEAAGQEDPKCREVERILLNGVEDTGPWLDRGCIVFTQYYDSALWLAVLLSRKLPGETVALYAGASRSGLVRDGVFTRLSRDAIKDGVREGTLRLVVGTDAASEGLNLQRLGTLINLDLPWNPTRLEQRKGRIQRIGQIRDEVYIYNLRYQNSVEDRVHELLSGRLKAIRDLFGQIPDTLEDAWVAVALRDEAKAREIIDQVPEQHPFEMRYDKVELVDWESCTRVLDAQSQLEALRRGW